MTKGGLSADDKTAIGVFVPVIFTDLLHRFRSELSGKNEAQQEKEGTLIEMPNETLNEMHADNDSWTEMPVSESRSVETTHEVVPLKTSPTLENGCTAVLGQGTVE